MLDTANWAVLAGSPCGAGYSQQGNTSRARTGADGAWAYAQGKEQVKGIITSEREEAEQKGERSGCTGETGVE